MSARHLKWTHKSPKDTILLAHTRHGHPHSPGQQTSVINSIRSVIYNGPETYLRFKMEIRVIIRMNQQSWRSCWG
ncbi:unnamed protein product [Allacma fusca]|uniref:Uncharacterized protein n=1 Tax=Allacma fusca TaxID=39272 RepID=A0A8J2L2J0_9HEXA|nr:unnamed protein product [Allacma fusca]